jgi:hypothetical protein
VRPCWSCASSCERPWSLLLLLFVEQLRLLNLLLRQLRPQLLLAAAIGSILASVFCRCLLLVARGTRCTLHSMTSKPALSLSKTFLACVQRFYLISISMHIYQRMPRTSTLAHHVSSARLCVRLLSLVSRPDSHLMPPPCVAAVLIYATCVFCID